MFITTVKTNTLIYDIETYFNCFTCTILCPDTGEHWYFEISDFRNDHRALCSFMDYCKRYDVHWVGYNNLSFDYPVMHFIYGAFQPTAYQIYTKGQDIIKGSSFAHMVWESDHVVKQIDLLKIWHFDNKAKSTSLKVLEFNMNMDNIEDLPCSPHEPLDQSQIKELAAYNLHDCRATVLFYKQSLDQIEFRKKLTEEHGINFINYNDTKIGKEYFIKELESVNPGCCYTKVTGSKKPIQTKRDRIFFSDIILPTVKFTHPNFQLIHMWMLDFSITKTKGALEFLEVTWEMAVNMNKSIIRVHGLTEHDIPKLAASTKITDAKLKKGIWLKDCFDDLVENSNRDSFKYVSGYKDTSGLNMTVEGFDFIFGTGGIHGSLDNAIIEATNGFTIIDIDVASYYPNLAIANNLSPEHLGTTFCQIYKLLYDQRKQHKKGTPQNAMLKLALNGVYGDSNNQYSPFYDPQYTMTITINGQLLLCMLAEVFLSSRYVKMIQINTDGMTIKVPNDLKNWVNDVCRWWESITGLELEQAEYSRMFIRDVNNYIAEYTSGKLKSKGTYAHKTRLSEGDKWHPDYCVDWHQNHSALVVSKAAEAYLVKGQNIEDFIKNHQNIHDFFLRYKAERGAVLHWDGEMVAGKIVRYYVSNTGGKLQKVMPPAGPEGTWKRASGITDEYFESIKEEVGDEWDVRIHTKNKSKYEYRTTELHTGYDVQVCNRLPTEFNTFEFTNMMNDINIGWYVKEAEKLVQMKREE